MLGLTSVRRAGWALVLIAGLSGAASVLGQSGGQEEARREGWQKADEIFLALGVRPGATVADVGSGDGFFTVRLARSIGPDGRVYAVDIDDRALDRLKRRLADERLQNVVVLKGTVDDPKLPAGTLDAALIVNAYHEMPQHHAMLTAVQRALKTGGRLVIVEPITDARRGRSRAEQVKNHEIAPELVLADARAAGFRIVGLQDPFLTRERETQWLLTLQPGGPIVAAPTEPPPAATEDPSERELRDPSLRISQEDFQKLKASGNVTVVDVRDAESFVEGHIPGAISIPLPSIDTAADTFKQSGTPIVTYCS